jgi:DNA sulfur modification protein DndE
MPIETFRLAEKDKDHLIKVKRWTGERHWNVLCRWAFCVSLAEPSIPPQEHVPADSSVEIAWKVFGGPYHEIYLALLRQRCREDGLGDSDDVLSTQFRLHLHRGIGYLAADRRLTDIGGLLNCLPPVHVQ